MTMNIISHGEKIATLNPTISGDAPDFELTDLKGNKTVSYTHLTLPTKA